MVGKQEEMKLEEISITYSWWDGSGHRKVVRVSMDYEKHPWDDDGVFYTEV